MQNSKENLTCGVYAASLMPLNQDLSCNHKELVCHCKDMIARGCQGIVLFGTMGEGPSFSLDERKTILKAVITEGLDPRSMILGNSSSGIFDTVDFIQTATQFGCMTFLVAPPCYYTNVPDEGVTQFYREIIQRVSNPEIKIILYHIPHLTGVPITMHVINILHEEFPHIVMGLKESEGDFAFTKKILTSHPNFKVYVGSEKQIVEAVQHGGSGAICGMPNLYPELICSLYERGKSSGDFNSSELEAFSKAKKDYQNISAFKAIMESRNGPQWHFLRPPLVPLNLKQREALIFSLRDFGLEAK